MVSDMEQKQTYKDLYYILGVASDASPQQIKEAYEQLYDKYGPHVNMGHQDPEANIKAYKDITEAYEVLGDPHKRRQYDEVAAQALNSKSHLRQLWGKLTGDGNEKPSGQHDKKHDPVAQYMEIDVTLKEAYLGAHRHIRIEESMPCQACATMKAVNRLGCEKCRGTGYIRSNREEELDMPHGMYHDQDIVYPGKGKFDMRAGRCGDLVLQVRLREHTFFQVTGRDVTCRVPVTIYEAVLGGEIQVPTPTGKKIVMKIQPLSQSGRIYRLKGIGLPGGDLLVSIEITIPHQVNAEEVAMFKKLQEQSTGPNPRDAMFAKLSS